MSLRRVCIAVLALMALGAVRARPSEGTAAAEAHTNLLDWTTISNRCTNTLTSFSTPQQIAGTWCSLETSGGTDTSPGAQPPCNRVTYEAVGNDVRVILNSVSNGEVIVTKNVTFTQIPNQSWLSTFEGRKTNFFVSLSSDSSNLLMCATTAAENVTPDRVLSITLGHCLRSDEVASVQSPNAVRCDLPSTSS